MTHTVESLMALHHAATAAALQYADCARVSLRSARSIQAADDRNEANDALRAALTEALAFNPDWADFENGRECGRLEAAQPNIQNYPEKDISQPVRDCPQPEICGSKECEFCRDTAQPVREPLTDEAIYSIVRNEFEHIPLPYDIRITRAIERAHGIGGGE